MERDNKPEICKALYGALKLTRFCSDMNALTYFKCESGDEIVIAAWQDGSVTMIDVTADSGVAMIYDIMKHFV